MWKDATTPKAQRSNTIVSPTHCGWILENNTYNVKWFEGDQYPTSIDMDENEMQDVEDPDNEFVLPIMIQMKRKTIMMTEIQYIKLFYVFVHAFMILLNLQTFHVLHFNIYTISGHSFTGGLYIEIRGWTTVF